MENRAITQGYMTVGELAKRMGTTVRTLQYYDREGLLPPSSESEGGRRLYTDKDMIRLYQIQSLKSLGFSLNAIKNCLMSLDTPADVAQMLAQQASAIREKIRCLTQSLEAIEKLKDEVLQIQTVDFKKYADIITNLQMNNESYWMIKHFDDELLDCFRSRFDMDSGMAMLKTLTLLDEEAIRLQRSGVPPEGEEGQKFAQSYWTMVMEFTGGDLRMLPKLMAADRNNGPQLEQNRKRAAATAYLEAALDVYLSRLGIDPFGEAAE